VHTVVVGTDDGAPTVSCKRHECRSGVVHRLTIDQRCADTVFLTSASYPYLLKTIRIRILSVSMVLLWYNYTASQKNSPDIFDCIA